MTDRELLELAAKAAGIEIQWREDGRSFQMVKGFQFSWNPLENDGDALLLAVTTGLDILHDEQSVTVKKFDSFNQRIICQHTEHTGRSSVAATRIAITRAAAEIGRNMQ